MGIGVLGDFVSGGTRRHWRPYGAGEKTAGFSFAWIWRPVLVAFFLFLLAGLLRTQIFQGSYFRSLADGNRVRRVPVHAPRGIIYDRNGAALVANLPSYRLKVCQTKGNCEASLISKTQAIDMLAKGLPENQSLEVDFARNYSYGEATAHLLGYVSQVTADELKVKNGYSNGDVVGRGGLEEEYENVLRGKDGEEMVEVDAAGQKLRTLAQVPPTPGQDLTTTIDITIQKVAYEQIKGGKGAVVATDPISGAVIAIASSPSFDPNIFTDFSQPADWRRMKVNEVLSDRTQPLFDRAISGTYPSGSTFKIVTATAGLETGKITQDTVIEDPGILIIGPYKFPNWLYLRNGGTQGTLNVVSAIQKSNDIFFYRVGEWVGVDGLADWAGRFGLANKLGIDLPGEAAGIFPTRLWRAENKPDWYLGDTYHLAIGQGDMLVTPLQVNRWTSVIANGGKICKPWLAKNGQLSMNNYQCTSVGLHQKTIDLVRQGMVEACSPGGTAWPLFGFKIEDRREKKEVSVQIACKTGTAEFGDPKDRTHAWLTGYAPAFAEAASSIEVAMKAESAGKPADLPAGRQGKPEIAVTVLMEGAGEGDMVAAPMVKKILEAWFNR